MIIMDALPANLLLWFPKSDPASLPWRRTFTAQYGEGRHAWVVTLEGISLCPVVGLDGWVAGVDVLVRRLLETDDFGIVVYQEDRLTLVVDFENLEALGRRELWRIRLRERLARERFLLPEPVWETSPDLVVRGDFSRERVMA